MLGLGYTYPPTAAYRPTEGAKNSADLGVDVP
jgi:hypothetical protein